MWAITHFIIAAHSGTGKRRISGGYTPPVVLSQTLNKQRTPAGYINPPPSHPLLRLAEPKPLHNYHYLIIIALYYYSTTTTLLLLFYYYSTTTTPLLLHYHYATLPLPLLLLRVVARSLAPSAALAFDDDAPLSS